MRSRPTYASSPIRGGSSGVCEYHYQCTSQVRPAWTCLCNAWGATQLSRDGFTLFLYYHLVSSLQHLIYDYKQYPPSISAVKPPLIHYTPPLPHRFHTAPYIRSFIMSPISFNLSDPEYGYDLIVSATEASIYKG